MSQQSSAAWLDYDWHRDITMPGDETQTLADVLASMRENGLTRRAAFVEWLADDWYDARQAIAEAEYERRDKDDCTSPDGTSTGVTEGGVELGHG